MRCQIIAPHVTETAPKTANRRTNPIYDKSLHG